MSSSTTSRLGLVKPTPGTGEPVNVATHLNANYDKIDAATGATICTSSTRPSAPWDGQFIRETDTGKLYVRNGTASSWDLVSPNPPKARVYAYKDNALSPANNTLTLVTFNQEVYKNESTLHSTSSNTSRFVAPRTGCYHISAQCQFGSNATGRRAVTLRKNAGGSAAGGTQVNVVSLGASSSDNTSVQVNLDFELNANDYLEMFVIQNSGVALALTLGSDNLFFQMREV